MTDTKDLYDELFQTVEELQKSQKDAQIGIKAIRDLTIATLELFINNNEYLTKRLDYILKGVKAGDRTELLKILTKLNERKD